MSMLGNLRKSLSQFFNRLAGKWQTRDLVYDLHPEKIYRAGMPPHSDTIDVIHGVKVSDHFRPLENIESEGTKNWVSRQQARFDQYIKYRSKRVNDVAASIEKALDYDSFGLARKYGSHYFRSFRARGAEQPIIQTATAEIGPWTDLIDPNKLATDGSISLNGYWPSKDGSLVAYGLSIDGDDSKDIYVIDVQSGKQIGPAIKNCRFTDIAWDGDSNGGFFYSYPVDDDSKRMVVKHHQIGANPETNRVIYDPKEDAIMPGMFILPTARYEWIVNSDGAAGDAGLLYRRYRYDDASFTEIIPPGQYSIDVVAEMPDDSVIAITNHDAPMGKVIRFDPQAPQPSNWTTVVPENAAGVIKSAFIHKNCLIILSSVDTSAQIDVYDINGKHMHTAPLPAQCSVDIAYPQPQDTELSLCIGSFLTSGDFYAYNPLTNKLLKTADSPNPNNLSGCIVERIYAISKDGTSVPMTVIRAPETQLDGTAALKLYGYGGFDISLEPEYETEIMHFVKAGGIYVQANLRGGGEFGATWYDQGRLLNKQNVFDDFIACAETLIGMNYTGPERLVINGGSNGGLLTSVAIQQRPELFGAVVTEVPVTDMFRFHLATYGAYWTCDYGDISIKEHFEAAAKYSPLHNVKPGAKYPPHLIMTADTDTRVLPWHAYKLAATLQAFSDFSNVTLLRVETGAGHGAGLSQKKRARAYAEMTAFVEKAIGPINQKDYLAEQQAKIVAAAEKKKAASETFLFPPLGP